MTNSSLTSKIYFDPYNKVASLFQSIGERTKDLCITLSPLYANYSSLIQNLSIENDKYTYKIGAYPERSIENSNSLTMIPELYKTVNFSSDYKVSDSKFFLTPGIIPEVLANLKNLYTINNNYNLNNLKTFVERDEIEDYIYNVYREQADDRKIKTKMVNELPEFAFANCQKLKTISNIQPISEDKKNNYTTLQSGLFYNCYVLPTDQLTFLNYSGYSSIGDYAFYNCSKIEYNSSYSYNILKQIGNSAFENCISLNKFEAPELSRIENNAFKNCISLSEFSAPNIKYIGTDAFKNCTRLSEFKAEILRDIGAGAFGSCVQLKTFSGGLNITNIQDDCFARCSSLSEVYMPKLNRIGSNAFSGCIELKQLNLARNSSQLTIGAEAFYRCSKLESLDFVNKCLEFEGPNIFQGNETFNKISINIVSNIYNGTFGNCKNLNEISIHIMPDINKKSIYISNFAFSASNSTTFKTLMISGNYTKQDVYLNQGTTESESITNILTKPKYLIIRDLSIDNLFVNTDTGNSSTATIGCFIRNGAGGQFFVGNQESYQNRYPACSNNIQDYYRFWPAILNMNFILPNGATEPNICFMTRRIISDISVYHEFSESENDNEVYYDLKGNAYQQYKSQTINPGTTALINKSGTGAKYSGHVFAKNTFGLSANVALSKYYYYNIPMSTLFKDNNNDNLYLYSNSKLYFKYSNFYFKAHDNTYVDLNYALRLQNLPIYSIKNGTISYGSTENGIAFQAAAGSILNAAPYSFVTGMIAWTGDATTENHNFINFDIG